MENTFKNRVVSIGKSMAITCPVCEFVLRDDEDVLSVKEEGACSECTINFKRLYIKQWKKGWRPSVSEARSKLTHI